MRPSLTAHAEARLQQRAIPPLVLDFLLEYGATMRCGEADRYYFDKAARKRLSRSLGGDRALRLVEPWLDTYAVVGDRNGRIVTTGHRTGRFKAPRTSNHRSR